MLSQEFLLKGVAAPLIAGFAATLLSMRLCAGRRGVGAFGLLVGQGLGTALSVWGQADWFPDRNLEWVPWVAAGASMVGPVLIAAGVTGLERWLLAALTSLAAAALIVPDWPDLWPSRPISILAVTGVMSLLACGIEVASRRVPPRLMAFSIASSAALATLLIAASLSLKLGGAALMTTASLAGVTIALLIRPQEPAVRGLALPFAVAFGGWCYVSAIELPPPTPPLYALLFVPLAPLTLWIVAVGPLSRTGPRVRTIAGLVVVITSLVAVAAWAWLSTEKTDDEYASIDGRGRTPAVSHIRELESLA